MSSIRRHIKLRLVVVAVLAAAPFSAHAQNPFSSRQPGYPKWSAFTGIKWEKDRPIVQFKEKWYELVSIHGVTTEAILKKCKEEDWDTGRRVADDLVQILRLMGQEVDTKTDLVLRDKGGKNSTFKDVAMTEANLRLLQQRSRDTRRRSTQPSSLNPFLSGVPGYPKWSAFTGVKWKGEQPIVEVNGKWYELLKFHGLTINEIREACDKNRWPYRHRFTEDLVQIVRLMGHEIDQKTDLELRDDTGKIVKLTDVAMTEANSRRIVRSAVRNETLSREDVIHDLEAFQRGLESQFAYLTANDIDYQAAIRAIAERTEEETSRASLARELQCVMAQFIDGHAGVSGSTALLADGFLPFLIESSGDQYAAVRPDRSGLVDNDFPFLRAIDGVAMRDWLKATEKYVAAGSPQYRRFHGLRSLRAIQQFRAELGREQTGTIEAELVSRDGKSKRTLSLDIADRRPIYGIWPPVSEPQILDGNIGYLRIASMNGEAVQLLQEWMPRFRDTAGLIVDVRGNGGGIRSPILELAGYLLSKDDEPRIGNVAKYRLAEQFGKDHLSAARFVYRETSPRFGDRERAAIHRFQQTFKPEWTPPADAFSEWHYLVLSKDADDRHFDYRRPVAILVDERSFSATDIFVGTFKGWPRVTLIGQASGGGSARTQSIRLPRSGISVRCASMASFQPDGRLYDTNGVEPDITVTRPPEYYVRDGNDLTLRKALTVLRNRTEAE